MARAALSRVLATVLLLVVVTALSFLLVAVTPGDAAREIVGTQGSQQAYEQVRHQLRLDQPVPEQYWHWLRNAVRGDLGASLFTSEPVTQAIDDRLPVTASLILGSLLVSLVLGVAVGVVSAVRGGRLGRFVDGLALTGFALPSFWVATALIALFAVRLRWLPATGYVPFADSPAGWLKSLVLPIAALSLGGVAAIAKQTREAMLDALGSEYVRMARASGISSSSIVFRHALKNAAMRVLTVVGWLFVSLLGGTVFVETVYALPGLGGLAVNSATQEDLPVIQGVVVYFTVIVVLVNLVVDLAYSLLDPRVRTR